MTHGFIWAPDMHPNICTDINTAKPQLRTIWRLFSCSFVFHLMQLEQLKNTSNAVPNSSAKKTDIFSKLKIPRFADDNAIVQIRLFVVVVVVAFSAHMHTHNICPQ